jgi:archaellum component FlaC
MYTTHNKEPFIEVDEEFHNDYKEIENKYHEMQSKLIPFHKEYDIKVNKAKNLRKIEELKREINKLEG